MGMQRQASPGPFKQSNYVLPHTISSKDDKLVVTSKSRKDRNLASNMTENVTEKNKNSSGNQRYHFGDERSYPEGSDKMGLRKRKMPN